MQKNVNDQINKSVTIGRFTIWEYAPGKVTITQKDEKGSDIDSGTFSEVQLEKVIGEFYNREF